MKKRVRKKSIYILSIILFVLTTIITFVGCIITTPKLYIEETDLIFNVNEEIKLPKPKATFVGNNISSKVKVKNNVDDKKIGKYKIKYQLDYLIFHVEKDRFVEIVDRNPPELTLNGEGTMTIYKGLDYEEPGYSAIDNYDGDITKKVVIDNNINKNEAGTYTVRYIVEDSSGNTASISREVKVIEKPVVEKTAPPHNGVIYLTFDDGPSATITPELLKILESENVKATFFIINHEAYLDYLIKKEYDAGHTVAIHSYTHNYQTIYSSVDAYFEDLEKMQAKIANITGEKTKIIRFPGGSSNTVSRKYKPGIMTELTSLVLERGYHYYDWNIGSGDSGDVKTSEGVYNNVTRNLSRDKANIILMHDFENNYKTLNAIRDIIKYGKDNGYTFDKITYDTSMNHHKVNN